MFESFFTSLKRQGQETEDDVISRRRFSRRDCDRCVTIINGKTYPVENWSQGGVLIYGDSRPFGLNDDLNVTMKFKLSDEIIDVSHPARVIRKSYDKIAFEFLPLTDSIKKGFQSVIDDHVAAEFAESQMI